VSNELKEALVEVESEADAIETAIGSLKHVLGIAREYEDDLEDLRKENESLKDEVVNLTNENDELEEQLAVLKKNLPAAERELTLWRLQQK